MKKGGDVWGAAAGPPRAADSVGGIAEGGTQAEAAAGISPGCTGVRRLASRALPPFALPSSLAKVTRTSPVAALGSQTQDLSVGPHWPGRGHGSAMYGDGMDVFTRGSSRQGGWLGFLHARFRFRESGCPGWGIPRRLVPFQLQPQLSLCL